MLTQDQIREAIKAGRQSQCLDSRDYSRLVAFFPLADIGMFGFSLNEGHTHTPIAWTQENVLAQLAKDVSFGFEKALDKRGISAALMTEVARMWMWILDDPLQYDEEYAQYGLPYFKRVALKYNLPNPIGDDTGTEDKYSEGGDD